MNRYAALIRGINVGGKTMKMDILREMAAELGCFSILTYIQSGNLIFSFSGADTGELIQILSRGIVRKFGYGAEVILKRASEFSDIIRRNPLVQRPDFREDRMYVTLLAGIPSEEGRNRLCAYESTDESFVLAGDVLYTLYKSGYGRSKFSNPCIERLSGQIATTRNWKTMLQVARMLEEPESF